MTPVTIAEQLFFVTLRLDCAGGGQTWKATGFIYVVETTRGNAHFLVSNRHVFENAETITVHFIAADGSGGAELGAQLPIAWANVGSGWVGHPNAEVDVAAASLSPLMNVLADSGRLPFFRAVAPGMLLTKTDYAELDAFENVVFVGYPSGIYDTTNLTPVMRRGTTATPISLDYRGTQCFLIDAAVYPGSSGSPVFLLDRGGYVNRAGGTVLGRGRFRLLGILGAVHVRTVNGQVVMTTALKTTFEEPIGLGIVYRAETIDTCIDVLLDRAQLIRKPSQPLFSEDQSQTPADSALDETVDVGKGDTNAG